MKSCLKNTSHSVFARHGHSGIVTFSDLTPVTPNGGVVYFNPYKMSALEAPLEGYEKSIRLVDEQCGGYEPETPRATHSRSVGFYFHSRGKQVYGFAETGFYSLQRKKENGYTEPMPARISRTIVNLGGSRTLMGGSGIVAEGLKSIRKPYTIPYKDPFTIDYSKITVNQDKATGILSIHGEPGAIPNVKTVYIKNNAPDPGEEIKPSLNICNPDGSFDVKINADNKGWIAMWVSYAVDDDFHHDVLTLIPVNKIIRLTEEFKQKHGSSKP